MAVLHKNANSSMKRSAKSATFNNLSKTVLPSNARKTAKQDVNPSPICKGSAPLENLNLPLKTFPLFSSTIPIKNTMPLAR